MIEPDISNVVLLLNSSSILLGRGLLQSPPDAPNMQIQVVDGLVDDLVQAELLQAVPQDTATAPRLGRIILRRGNRIVLEPLRILGDETRQNLRVPVDFESFVYPDGGRRAVIKADNTSSSGIAFYTTYRFAPHERFEIVIPITSEPLLVWGEILRQKPYTGPVSLYAAAFSDLINDEEVKIREAVFSVQIRQKASILGDRRV